jgi:hypothetical protein
MADDPAPIDARTLTLQAFRAERAKLIEADRIGRAKRRTATEIKAATAKFMRATDNA